MTATAWIKTAVKIPENQLVQVLRMADYFGHQDLYEDCLRRIVSDIKEDRLCSGDVRTLYV